MAATTSSAETSNTSMEVYYASPDEADGSFTEASVEAAKAPVGVYVHTFVEAVSAEVSTEAVGASTKAHGSFHGSCSPPVKL